MEQFCLAHGFAVDEWITEVGGGMNLTRRKFLNVMDAVDRADIATVVVAHKDRITVGIDVFGRQTPVEVSVNQVRAV